MKYFFYDLETTGVKYWRHGIHQISGMIVIDGEVKERFDYRVKPYHKAIIEDEALAIGGITREDLEAYEEMKSVHILIVNMLSKYVDRYDKRDKMFLAGYNNGPFDNPFLRAFFVQNGDKYFGSWFWPGSIDVMTLSLEYLKDERHTMENFKLMSVARHLGITVDDEKLHDAMYDIDLTYETYKIVAGNKDTTEDPAWISREQSPIFSDIYDEPDPDDDYITRPSKINGRVP